MSTTGYTPETLEPLHMLVSNLAVLESKVVLSGASELCAGYAREPHSWCAG